MGVLEAPAATKAELRRIGFWVDDYILPGDTSDDQAAQRAVNACAARGAGKVLFTVGKIYTFLATVTISSPFVQLVGHRGGTNSTGSTIVKGADVTLFDFKGTRNTRLIRCGLRDLTLHGAGDSHPTWTAPLVTAEYASQFHRKNVRFTTNFGPGVVCKCVWDSWWTNDESDSVGGTDGNSPVVLITPDDAATVASNNIWIVNYRYESLRDGAVWVLGTAAHPCNNIKLVNGKIETHTSTGYPLRGDLFRYQYAEDCQSANLMFDASGAPDSGFTAMALVSLLGGVKSFQAANWNMTAVGASGSDFASLIHMDSTVAPNVGMTWHGLALDTSASYPGAVFVFTGTGNYEFGYSGLTQNQTAEPIPVLSGQPTTWADQLVQAGRATFSNAAYTMKSRDRYVAQIGTLSAPRTVTLPAANSVPAGSRHTLADESNTATFANSITWAPAGSDTWIGANAAAPPIITNAGGRLEAISDGTSKWFLVIRGVNLQEFATPGTATWYKPPGASIVTGTLVGGGAGGGSGRRGATNTVRCGGAGGSPGPVVQFSQPASYFGATETVTVAATANGGGAQTADDTDGIAGTAGNPTSITGTTGGGIVATGNGAGAGGTATSGVAGQAGFGTMPSTQGGGASTTGGGGSSGAAAGGAGGGGAGGGVTSGNAAASGGAGGAAMKIRASGSTSGGTAGAPSGGGGSAGGPTSAPAAAFAFGAGGGGGAGHATGVGGTGGDGGFYGGGGGGGGASLNGNNSGAGGRGQQGYALIATTF